MNRLDFWVPGTPRPKGSPKIAIRKSTGKRFVVESQTQKDWQDAVAERARWAVAWQSESCPVDCPVSVVINFILPKIKSAKTNASSLKLAAVKPDLDKLVRTVLDALEGIVYTNDSRVVDIVTSKRTAMSGEPAGVKIYVTT